MVSLINKHIKHTGALGVGTVTEQDFVNDFLNHNISRTVFWEYAKFKHPTHQISFHSIRALECLKFERSEQVNDGTME